MRHIHSWFKRYRLGIAAAILMLSLGVLSISTIINIYFAKESLTREIIAYSKNNIEKNSSRLILFTDQLFSLSLQLDHYPKILNFFNIPEVNYYLEYLVLTKLREIDSIYSFIDSIQLYNQKAGRIIDTKTGCFFLNNYSNLELIHILSHPIGKNLILFPRKELDKTDLVTLLYYSGNVNDKIAQYALIINIKEDVFYESINFDKSDSSQHYILDDKRFVISHSDKSLIGKDFSSNKVIESIHSETLEEGMMKFSIDKVDQLLFFQKIPHLNWLLISSTNMTQLLSETTRLQTKMLIISGILFFMSVLFSVVVSKILYKPINELVQKINPENNDNKNLSDIELISDSYDDIARIKESLLLQNKENYTLLQKNLLRRIFLTGIEQHELEFELERFKLNKIRNNRVILADLPSDFTPFEAGKLFSEITSCIIISINKKTLAIWILQGNNETVIREYLNTILSNNPELTFAVSDIIHDNSEIQTAYREAEYYLKHKIIFGHGCIIDSTDIKKLEEKPCQDTISLENSIIASIKSGQKDDFEIYLSKLFTFCSSISYRNIEKIMLKMGESCIRELDSLYPSEDTDFNFSTTWNQIAHIKEMKEWFTGIFDLYHTYYLEQKLLSSASNINKQKISKAADYIQVHYMDYNICLTLLADQAELSPNYFNLLFKQVTGKTLPNYINQYRFDVAKQFLRETNDKISNVAKRTGFANLNYFYYKFKKDIGMTPLDYRSLYKNRSG